MKYVLFKTDGTRLVVGLDELQTPSVEFDEAAREPMLVLKNKSYQIVGMFRMNELIGFMPLQEEKNE